MVQNEGTRRRGQIHDKPVRSFGDSVDHGAGVGTLILLGKDRGDRWGSPVCDLFLAMLDGCSSAYRDNFYRAAIHPPNSLADQLFYDHRSPGFGGLISFTAYTLYLHLINHAGPVFTRQVANLVTLCGVLWGMILFGERHSAWIWLSLATMMAGVFLVVPRIKAAVATE